MFVTTQHNPIRTLKPGDKNFRISDGMITAPRAGFEISTSCPTEYQQIIQICINAGWLKSVANVTERELLFMGLSEK